MSFQQFASTRWCRSVGTGGVTGVAASGSAHRRPRDSTVGSWHVTQMAGRGLVCTPHSHSRHHGLRPPPGKDRPHLQQVLLSHLPQKGPEPSPLRSQALFKFSLLPQASGASTPTQRILLPGREAPNLGGRRSETEQCKDTDTRSQKAA